MVLTARHVCSRCSQISSQQGRSGFPSHLISMVFQPRYWHPFTSWHIRWGFRRAKCVTMYRCGDKQTAAQLRRIRDTQKRHFWRKTRHLWLGWNVYAAQLLCLAVSVSASLCLVGPTPSLWSSWSCSFPFCNFNESSPESRVHSAWSIWCFYLLQDEREIVLLTQQFLPQTSKTEWQWMPSKANSRELRTQNHTGGSAQLGTFNSFWLDNFSQCWKSSPPTSGISKRGILENCPSGTWEGQKKIANGAFVFAGYSNNLGFDLATTRWNTKVFFSWFTWARTKSRENCQPWSHWICLFFILFVFCQCEIFSAM